MPNTLTAVIPRILAQGLLALRGATIMPRLVNTDYGVDAKSKGSTVDVPIPSAVAAQQVAPAATPPATADSAPTTISIPLDQWYEAPFYLTDKDMLEAVAGVIPMQASEAIKSLGQQVNSYLFGLYTGVYGFTGTPATTPFSSGTTEATAVRKILNQQLAPLGDRRVVLDPDSEANALNLRAFQDTGYRGDDKGITEGMLGRKFGFDWYMDQQVPSHTAGTITTGLISKAATNYAIGVKTLLATTAASTGACNLKVGDVINFAGDVQTYVLTSTAIQAAAASDVTLNFEPGLKVAHVGSEAVTVKSSHVVNLAFHRDAFAFASRPLEDTNMPGLGAIIQSATDPVSGLSLRLEVRREHKRMRWSFDILYGGALVRRELASRLAG